MNRTRILSAGLATAVAVVVGPLSVASAITTRVKPALEVQGAPVTRPADCPGVPTPSYVASDDHYSLYWQELDAGTNTFYDNHFYGQGVDVALIDTGVGDVHHNDGTNEVNVIDGPDFSFDSQAPYANPANNDLPHNDGYGHGTHMAGIIGGHDVDQAPYGAGDSSKFTGVAPGARIVNLKVADGSGAVDVSQVIAAVDWAVQHRNDYGLHIRVINLSYGFVQNDPQKLNPLVKALTEAAKAGIVVVTSAGNSGHGDTKTGPAGLLAPAYAYSVIAVGSYDNGGTPYVHTDDTSSDFSSAGKGRPVDFVAPGEHMMSLHVTGSEADNQIVEECQDALSKGQTWSSPIFGPQEKFIRGSGTSQAAAFTSGVVALMLSANDALHPGQPLSPAQVKAVLKDSARPHFVPGGSAIVGQGELDATGAFGAIRAGVPSLTTNYPQAGGDDLLATRGFSRDALPCTNMLTVELYKGHKQRVNHRYQYTGDACSELYNVKEAQGLKALAHQIDGDIHGQYFDAVAHACDEEINPVKTRCMGEPAHMRRPTWTDNSDGQWWNNSLWTGSGFHFNPVLNRQSWDTVQWTGLDWQLQPWSSLTFVPNHWIHDEVQGVHWKGNGTQGTRWVGNVWRDEDWLGTRWVGNIWRDCTWA